MKTVLLHVHDDAGQEARLLAALAIIRQHDARLICIQVTPLSDFVVTDPLGGMYAMNALFDQLTKQAVEARKQVEQRLAKEGIEAEWSVHNGNIEGTIVKQSRLCDLIVLSQSDAMHGAASHPLSLVADVAIHARTPVLAVPIAGKAFDPGGTAMIAWNGSTESAHAVRAALPLLRHATAVHVVTLDEDEDFPVDDVRRYLASHGVSAECSRYSRDGTTVGEALCNAASLLEAAYVVMGAYGHSRFRETVLGGVSRHMLQHSPVPLLLTH